MPLLPLLLALQSAPALPMRELLAIERLGERKRCALYTDALEAELARGTWKAPHAGEIVRAASGEERSWTSVEAGADGSFSGPAFSGGWAFATLDVPAGGAWRLDASGHSAVFVDGEPHAGDVYSLGITRVPLALTAGRHEFLFLCGRGSLRATLEPAPAGVYLEERDRTLPDVIRGETEPLLLSVIVANATSSTVRGYRIRARAGELEGSNDVPLLLPSSFVKCPVVVGVPTTVPEATLDVRLDLVSPDGSLDPVSPAQSSTLTLAVRDAHELQTRTFVSAIDCSVQSYSVVPPSAAIAHPALILGLHGAGVEARGHAACYPPLDWAVVAAPTNRRPYGFDWEDWGRLDALEVLALAAQRYDTDPRRTYLTGHSMGGHGTWQIGAHFPGLFAAIAPSAGWRDFWSYGNAVTLDESDPLGKLLARAANASRTGLLERNYAAEGVYVLHGDADDNVPVSEARAMREHLAGFHPNFAYYERPGAGHWWGNECVSWPPLLAFLKANVLPEASAVTEVDFRSVNPGLSSTCRWVTIEQQTHALEPSHVDVRLDVEKRTLEFLALENVAAVSLDFDAFPALAVGGALHLVYDGGAQELATAGAHRTFVVGSDGALAPSLPPAGARKNPLRAGPFKDAFRDHFMLVYGTHGTSAENAWALAKARYDHEQWRYRGNGAVELCADTNFMAAVCSDRGVVLYGNQDTNSAWSSLLAEGALELRRDHLRVGEHTLTGDDLALLAIRPRKDSDTASVAIVGGTGLTGCRATTFLPYFSSGVAYPDWIVLGADFLTRGLAGVRAAGFFANDWTLGADLAWR